MGEMAYVAGTEANFKQLVQREYARQEQGSVRTSIADYVPGNIVINLTGDPMRLKKGDNDYETSTEIWNSGPCRWWYYRRSSV